MDISFTEEDQSETQLHITNVDQSKTDKKSPPRQSSTQEKGKILERKDKQLDFYGEDEANYIVTEFQPLPTSMAVRDILIYDIPAK
ncbi:hypothetical protein RCL_jg24123.t2 [Rhizophagus clarus]|nr:hypothetical protein RCL_jg24123.t2 [Rhizophagus clarus]